jgi:hypothetical protein
MLMAFSFFLFFAKIKKVKNKKKGLMLILMAV